jgi:hypothetical protein
MSKFTQLSAVVAAVLLVNVGAARASDAAPVTRADVIAELDAARSSGELAGMAGEDSGSIWLSRQAQERERTAQRTAPLQRSARAAPQGVGCSNAMLSEDSGSFCLAALPNTSTLTRAQVVAELLQARDSGMLQATLGEDSGSMLPSRPAQAAVLRYAGPNVGHPHDPTPATGSVAA